MADNIDPEPSPDLDVLRPILSAETLRQLRGPGAPYYIFVTKQQALTCDSLIREWGVVSYWPHVGPPRLVGRVGYGHCIIPALMGVFLSNAIVCENQDYIYVSEFEVLLVLRGRVVWIPASNGDAPPYGVPVGLTVEDDPEYAVRVLHGGTWVMGRLRPNKQHCEVLDASGNLLHYRNYQVLAVLK